MASGILRTSEEWYRSGIFKIAIYKASGWSDININECPRYWYEKLITEKEFRYRYNSSSVHGVYTPNSLSPFERPTESDVINCN